MKPHQARVIQEKKDLDEKIARLFDFIASESFKKLDRYEQLLLREQYHCMNNYSNVLNSRLEHWQEKEGENENLD